MRKFIRTLLLLLLFAAIFPFLYPWQDGKPLLSWSDLRLPAVTLPELPALEPASEASAAREAGQPLALYRWQDEQGSVQFSNEPPPDGVHYEVVEVYPDANLIQAPPKQPEATPQPAATEQPPSSPLPAPLTVSPEKTLKLFEDAQRIREMSEQRLQEQKALTR